MVAIQPRLTLQQQEIAADTRTLRSLDWDRSRFDIEFGLRNGTTYNAFLVRGERSTSSPYVLSYRTGDEIEIVADGEVDGWLRLTNQRGWVLRDGAHLGFGLLVVPLPPLTARSELAALPPLTVRAVDGLCNRLRVVLSYAAVARRHGRRLLVWWPLISVCDGRFTDAFIEADTPMVLAAARWTSDVSFMRKRRMRAHITPASKASSSMVPSLSRYLAPSKRPS